ncbi:MAG TPA: replicative DNA helicase [Gemmataceae bacterium]|nr:replicative DNA helicase [Gemmataceae bacterium]
MNDAVMDRLPPHNRDAERALLGSMLRDNYIIPEVVNLVKADHFYAFAHQKIFEAISKLNDDAGKPADIITVPEYLSQARVDPKNENSPKLIEEVGGIQYVVELFDAAPAAAHYRQYCEIVRQKAMLRSLIHACTGSLTDAFNARGTSAADILDTAERRLFEIRDGSKSATKHAGTIVDEMWKVLDERRARGSIGIQSGFAGIDKLTSGFQPGELAYLAARTSVGKTAFALNMASHMAIAERVPLLFISLEQSRIDVMSRLTCIQGLVDSHRFRNGRLRPDETTRAMAATDRLSRSRLHIDDGSGQSVLQIAANIRRARRAHGIELAIIDYLGLIEPEKTRAKTTRQEEVAATSRRLKLLAAEINIPIIVLAQVNRDAEKRGRGDNRPRLIDLRESGAIEQDADVVVFLHRLVDDRGGDEGLVDAIVAKQRNGPTGTVSLLYVKQHMRFVDFVASHK